MRNSLESDTEDAKIAALDLVVLGQLGKVHGIKGWLRLNSFTEPLENILDYAPLRAEIEKNWQILEIDQFRQQPNRLLVHFKGYDNPEVSRSLTGLELWVEKKELPQLDAGEYYWRQLEGLKVVNQHGLLLGQVSKLLETGANDVLVVAPNQDSVDERERLIPYLLNSVIAEVDLDKQTIKVDWEADYLD